MGPTPERDPEPEPAPAADATFLFRDDPPAPGPAPEPSGPAGAAVEGEAYDLGGEEPPASEPAPPIPPAAPAARATLAEGRRPRVRLASEEPEVDQVWSRWLEWGPAMARVALAFLVAAFLAWLTFSLDALALSMLLFAALMAVPVVLMYPILITLERPVRVVPQQAVEQYFGALSHHRPHYRRMWLLLSRAGRTTAAFASPEGFQAYWDRRLAELRGPGVSGWTPLQFEVVDFKSDKSVGKSRVEASYTVEAYVRGRRAEGPVHAARVQSALVRGPDNAWYLEDGLLP